jgi:hypothetical protein
MKLLFPAVALGLLSFLVWGVFKPAKPRLSRVRQSWYQTTEEPSDSMDDPNLPPLRDPWDKKWQI